MSEDLPQSLFLKIFLWFGGVVLTFIVMTFVADEMRRHPDSPHSPVQSSLNLALNAYGQTVVQSYEKGGASALAVEVGRIQTDAGLRVFLFDRGLNEMAGRQVPAGASQVAQRVFETHEPQTVEGPLILRAKPVTAQSGGQYVLVAAMPAPQPSPFFHYPFMHVIVIALIGGLFCYGLARHLTSPVAKLRAATQELARGNLSARVGPSLGNRRDELVSLADDFDEMAEKIQSLVESQRRLLGDISHELRSPLARLNVGLELARQRSGAEAAGSLERIQHEADILKEMIAELLTLTRLESSASEIQKREFDLQPLLSDVVNDAAFEASARNRSVNLVSAEPAIIDGEPNLIRRALENVIRNAAHYTAPGAAVEIKLFKEPAVSAALTGKPNAERAVITVRDHGPGVPDEALGKLFRPFYRVDEARDREAGGVGLGLAIAERAVRLHGGTVMATNAPDGGLLITLTLPDCCPGKTKSQEVRAKGKINLMSNS